MAAKTTNERALYTAAPGWGSGKVRIALPPQQANHRQRLFDCAHAGLQPPAEPGASVFVRPYLHVRNPRAMMTTADRLQGGLMHRFALTFALVGLSTGIAFAATGKPDIGNYVASDSLNPAPKLPVGFLTPVDTTGLAHTTITPTIAEGDDASYGVNLAGARAYGSTLTGCAANMNGYVVCGG